jgi:putative transposase
MSTPDRRSRLDREHTDLSVRRQCALLGLARSGVYRAPRPVNDDDLGGITVSVYKMSQAGLGNLQEAVN